MAKKKSALSKGYRKTQQKKPFLTKKEIIALIIIVAVVVAAFIVINNLPDGYIGESAVKEGDILAYGTKDTRNRYVKLGTINELEGFTRTDTKAETTAMVSYTYTPDDESSNIEYITVSGSPLVASDLVETMVASMPGYGYTVGEVQEVDVQGYNAYVYGSTTSYYDEAAATEETAAEETATEETATEEASTEEAATEEVATEEAATEEVATEEVATEEVATEEVATEEAATEEAATEETAEEEETPNTFSQDVTVYVDCGNDHTLAMHLVLNGTDESVFVADDAIVDFIMPYTNAFTLVEKEEAK